MRKSILLVMIVMALTGMSLFRLQAKELGDPGTDEIEKEILKELNLARTHPARYASYIEDFKRHYAGKYIYLAGRTPIVTREGAAAVNEAIDFLKAAAPVPELRYSLGLSKSAGDQVANQGPTGRVGHDGPDGSTTEERISRYGKWGKAYGENIEYGNDSARQIVMQLIIDDGVPNRGHRTQIFNPAYRWVGISFGTHHAYRSMCVMDFAAEYEPYDD